MGMLFTALGLLVLAVYGSLVLAASGVATWSNWQILAQAPHGQKHATLLKLSLWQFGAIERQLGPAVHLKLLRLKRASILAMILVAAPIVLVFLVLAASALARKLGIV